MITYTWAEYEKLVIDLHAKILQAFPDTKPIVLHGVPRGGLLLAIMLSYRDKRFVLPMYGRVDLTDKHLLIVDDVLEKGKTRTDVYAILWSVNPRPSFAVLVDKSSVHNIPPADISALSLYDKAWVKFPYENGDDEEVESKHVYGKDHK